MDLSPDTTQFLDATRRDGWTPALKARFLALLADSGNVRLCARRCGLSAQSAYVQRRRDALFARGWAAALMLARDHAEQVLADRAIEGVEEEVWYRGELVATRRKYDTRLLLAHLARLDRHAEEQDGAEEAGRFDELLAMVAGEDVPEALVSSYEDEVMPVPRERHLRAKVTRAEWAVRLELDEGDEPDEEEFDEFDDPDLPDESDAMDDLDELDTALMKAAETARTEAVAEWDAWFDRACATVDALVNDFTSTEEQGEASPTGRELVSLDRVNPSTSGAPRRSATP